MTPDAPTADDRPDARPEPAFEPNVFARDCGSRAAFEAITGRWTSLILIALVEGPHRFGELRRRVDGVSEKMLSQSLHALEREGLLTRTDHGTVPPRVDYALTPLGVDVAGRLRALADVLQDPVPQFEAARAEYDGQ